MFDPALCSLLLYKRAVRVANWSKGVAVSTCIYINIHFHPHHGWKRLGIIFSRPVTFRTAPSPPSATPGAVHAYMGLTGLPDPVALVGKPIGVPYYLRSLSCSFNDRTVFRFSPHALIPPCYGDLIPRPLNSPLCPPHPPPRRCCCEPGEFDAAQLACARDCLDFNMCIHHLRHRRRYRRKEKAS